MRAKLNRLTARLAQRNVVVAAILVAVACCCAAAIVLWRPAIAGNDPYQDEIARWTVTEVPGSRTFVGLGSLLYRENWRGPAQDFAGPVLLRVTEADTPVRITFSGPVSVADSDTLELTTTVTTQSEGTPTPTELALAQDEMVALPAETTFQVTTGDGEVVRLIAIVLIPGGPPQTPGVEQAEWRAWGVVTPAPEVPLVVSMVDISLNGGEDYRFQRDNGPALLYLEGSGDGTQPIALTLTKGRGTYMRVAEIAPYRLTNPVSYLAAQTPVALNREKAFEGRSGAYLAPGTQARIRNRGLVDGTGMILVTFDGPNVVPLSLTPTASPMATLVSTATPQSGDESS